MNVNSFTENIMGPLEEKIFSDGRAVHERRLVVHMDNAPIHNCVMTTSFLADHNLVRLQHPPYSPDLSSSDFYLFPTVKEKLKDIGMVDGEDLFYGLQELLNDIPIRELHKVFTA
jgi:histone-lysine N-methyltransferase SETMAR